MKPKFREHPAPFHIGQRRVGRVSQVVPWGIDLEIDGARAEAVYLFLGLPSEKNPQQIFQVGDMLDVRIIQNQEFSRIRVEIADPETQPWWQFARRYKTGDEIVGRVHRRICSGLLVELYPGVIGLLRLHANFPREVPPRDFLQVYTAGEPIRVRIAEMDARWRKCALELTETEKRRWIGPARRHAHWP